MAEKEPKHIVDKYIGNCQRNRIFILSTNTSMCYNGKEMRSP